MKHTSITLLALALTAACTFVACASGGEGDSGSATVGGVGGNGGVGGGLTTTSTSTGSGPGVCAPKCTTDQECQSSCPESTGNPYCCDLATTTCYQSTLPMCPANQTGSTTSSSGGY